MSEYANKGKGLEKLVALANKQYEAGGIALVQAISTPWTVLRKGARITSAFPSGKSTVDYRGTLKGGTSISFDCKETIQEKGLPLANVLDHQVDFMKKDSKLGGVTFLIVHIRPTNKYYRIDGQVLFEYWDLWKTNHGKRGYNFIPATAGVEIDKSKGVVLDYLKGVEYVSN